MTKILSEEILQKELNKLSDWTGDTDAGLIQKDFSFKDFSDAMVFVNRVAEIAEEENHHPDICISYNSVTIILTTHDAGGVTLKDLGVARRIEEVEK